MKKIIFLLIIVIGISSNAQINVGHSLLNGVNPSSAFLDASTNYSIEAGIANNLYKGIVVPSVDLVNFEFDLTVADGITLPTFYDGMLVYNRATGNTLVTGNRSSTATAVSPGYYYFYNPNGAANGNVKGGVWKSVGAGWALTGNAGTTAGTNFVGTTDAQDFVMKSNGTEGIRITTTGNVGVKTSTPMSTLTVEGSLETAFKEITANYTLTDKDYYTTYSGGGAATITLPVIGTTPTTSFSGRIYRIKNVSNNMVTLRASGTNLIRPNSTNVATYNIPPGSYVEVVNNNKISGGVWDLSYVANTSSTFNDTSGSEVRKLQYYGTPDSNRTLKHGPFEFRMIPSGRNSLIYQARINPDYGLQSGESVTVTYTQKKAWGGPDNGGSRGSITFSSGNWGTYQDPWERIFVENNGHNLYFSVDLRSAPSIANRLVQLGALQSNQSPMFYNLLVQNTQDTRLKSLISIRY